MLVQGELESLTAGVKAMAKNADEEERKKIVAHLRDLARSLEDPGDAMQRIMYSAVETSVSRIGCDIKLYEALQEGSGPMTVEQLSKKIECSPLLLARLCRYLGSVGVIQEVGPDTYTTNAISNTMTIPGCRAGILHGAWMIPVWGALPDALKANNYRHELKSGGTAFGVAFNTDKNFFDYWATDRPEWFSVFADFMTEQHHGKPIWLDTYPIEERIDDIGPDQVLFVDVGGGVGHQSIALRERFPQLSNRIINQDRLEVIDAAAKHTGVEYQIVDFYDTQKVQGAKIYYLRNILHDWTDDVAIKILRAIIPALGPDSVIMIDEMVMPSVGAHWHATQLDLLMYVVNGAIERTEAQWENLMSKAGLKIRGIHTYMTSLQHSIIECVPRARTRACKRQKTAKV